MSLINQMLSDLEKRGAGGVSGEPTIRPVSVQGNKRKSILWMVAALLLIVIAGLWWGGGQRHPAASENMPHVNAAQAPDHADNAPQIVTQATTQQDTIIEQKADMPALLLSSELSSLPLPSSLRNNGQGKSLSHSDGTDSTTSHSVKPPVEKLLAGRPNDNSQVAGNSQDGDKDKILLRESHANSVPKEVPIINSVSPDPIVATGVTKPLTINGNNFAKGAKVTLRFSKGQKFTNRPISSQNASQIIINPNLGAIPGAWTVEVINPGNVSSGQFTFTVQAPTVEANARERKNSPSLPVPSANNKVPTAITAPLALPQGSVDKQIKPVNVQQQADNEFRKANILMQQGRNGEAIAGYETALQLDADHDAARLALAGLLLESKRNTDAESVLQQGLNHNPKRSDFAMLLARLQVEREALQQALETLLKTAPYAGKQADYQAFIAAVQQRMGHHKEAVAHYQIALQASPDSGIWLMGLGISLKALQQKDEARVAFKHALESHTLNADLQAFVTQQLKEL